MSHGSRRTTCREPVRLTISEQLGEKAAGTVTMTFLPVNFEKFKVSVGELTFTVTSGTASPTLIWAAAAREATAE
jgi:hypothetical protein